MKPGEMPAPTIRHFQAKWPSAHFTLKKTLSERFHAYLLDYDCVNNQAFDLDLLRNEPSVISASWNELVEFRRDSVPNDTLFSSQWNLEKIRLPEVWSLVQGGHTPSGKEIVVAVIDNGFDLLHPDLQANFWRNPNEVFDGQDNDGNDLPDDVFGWNFHDNSPLFPLTSSHGTGVCGVIGAQGNNVTGITGVNWQVKILPMHFQETAEIIPAFEYVLNMRERYNVSGGTDGAFVVVTNGSFGLKEPVDCSTQPIWGMLYDTLGAVGVLSVAATRNDNYNIDETGDMPSSCPSEYLITVTASDSTDQKLAGVAFGKKTIDLAAPGSAIPTTDLNGRFRFGFEGHPLLARMWQEPLH